MIRLGKVALDLINKLIDTQGMLVSSLLSSNMALVKQINDTSTTISRINKDLLIIQGEKVPDIDEEPDLNELLLNQARNAIRTEVREFKTPEQNKAFMQYIHNKYSKTPEQMEIDQEARDKAYKLHLEQVEKWKQAQQQEGGVSN